MRPGGRFTAEKSLGINSSMSGHILDKAIRNSLFWEYDNKAESDKNRTMFEHYNKLKNKVELMHAFGDVTPEMVDNMIYETKSITETKFGKSVFKSNLSGILMFIANSQHSRAMNSLKLLKNENFPDTNKIDRTQDRVDNLKVIVDALDRQMSRDLILRKDQDVFMKKIPVSKDNNIKWSRTDFNADGNLYRIKGDIEIKDLSSKRHPKSIEYVQPVKKGRKVAVERGYTYLVDKRPPKFFSVSDSEARWNRAFRSATQVDILRPGDIHTRYDPDMSPVTYSEFVSDVGMLRRGVNDYYSKARKRADESLIDKGDIYFYNSVITDRMIGDFFKKHSEPQHFESLLRFLLQPKVQPNVYIKEGPVEIPYYRMNNTLIESVFNWMRRPATATQDSNAERFGFNAENIIRSIVHDTNAFHDHRIGDVEFKTQQYNRMKMKGKEDFNRLRETTTDIMLKDWYHSPVLSKYSRDFFLGKGDIVRRKDVSGREHYFYDYRKAGDIEKYEKIMGCK